MDASAACENLPWDSDFFGIRIGRARANRATASLIIEIDSWSKAENVACVYFLADSSDPETLRLLQQNGYAFVDVRACFGQSVRDSNAAAQRQSWSVREAKERDIPALRALAAKSHHQTRFYSDGRFPACKCDELYQVWIEKSCRGWAAQVFTCDGKNGPGAYLTCNQPTPGVGEIGLVAVGEDLQGQGVGRSLVRHALSWFVASGTEQVEVTTQGCNVAAQRLYEECGFRVRSANFWFHKWFRET